MNESAFPEENLLRFISNHTFEHARVEIALGNGSEYSIELSRLGDDVFGVNELRALLAGGGEIKVGVFSDGTALATGEVAGSQSLEFRAFMFIPQGGTTTVYQATRNLAGTLLGRRPRAILGADKSAEPAGPFFGHQSLLIGDTYL